jgi:hypothetical protein
MGIVEKHEERNVYAPISEEDARRMMVELADAVRRGELLKEEKKHSAAGYKKDIDSNQKRQIELVGIVTSRTMEQRRMIRITYDFGTGLKHGWSPFRPNTIIFTEPISEEERQKIIPKIGAGEGPADSPSEVQAEIFAIIEHVVCRRCHRAVPKDDAAPVEERDKKSGELIRTEFLCRDGEECGDAAGSVVEAEVIEDDDAGDELAEAAALADDEDAGDELPAE